MPVVNLHGDSSPKSGYYILDSNIWLPILGLDESGSEHYKNFFDKIFKTDGCKILLCPVQISEILNRLLRFHANKVYDQKYKSKTGAVPKFAQYYKGEYRGSEDFKRKFESIIDDLTGYESHIEIVEASQLNFSLLTGFDARQLDFNDHYLCLLALEKNAFIITHDADFFDTVARIGTFNVKLYKQYTSAIKPSVALKA